MIGARVLQHRITRDAVYLEAAEAIARQTLATFGDFTNHPPSFNAMCFQNMLMLHATTSESQLRQSMRERMERFGNWAWTAARDSENLFYFDDAGQPAIGQQPARVQDQGAMVQLYALLACEPRDYGNLT
jgi:hypothetical protein